MKKTLKLYMIDEKPYFVSLDPIQIGDKAIVSVNDQYPSIVDCINQQVIDLITNPRLTFTKAHKIFLTPETINLDNKTIQQINEQQSIVEVEVNGQEIKYEL